MADWLIYSFAALIGYGVVGLLQKLTTNRISGDSALVFYSLGYLVLFPIFWSRAELTASDILKALELYWTALNLLLALTIALGLVLWRFA